MPFPEVGRQQKKGRHRARPFIHWDVSSLGELANQRTGGEFKATRDDRKIIKVAVLARFG